MNTTPSQAPQSFLYARLSSFYFFYFATIGVFIPYWSLYLKSLNFSAVEIGELMAMVMASKLVAPYLLGWLSDHIQKRLIIIQVSLFLAALIFSGVLTYQSYWWFMSIMAIFGFLWNASLPLFESLTLNYLGRESHRYSHIRLWGSIGFILVVVVVPIIIEKVDIAFLPIMVLVALILNGLATFLIKDSAVVHEKSATTKLLPILKHPVVIAFLVVCAIQTMSHGAYYTFFSIYLDEHNYSKSVTGIMWGLGVLAEVILFIIVQKFFARYGVCKLFIIALLLTVIRWLMLAYLVDSLVLLIFIQLFHAASFGLFHVTAIELTHILFPGRLQARGQALYAGLSFGLGGALGNWLSGHSWEAMGSTWTFLASAVVAFVGAMIAIKYIKEDYYPAYAKKL